MAARGRPAGSLSPGSLQKALTGAISTVLTEFNKSASATHRWAPSNTSPAPAAVNVSSDEEDFVSVKKKRPKRADESGPSKKIW